MPFSGRIQQFSSNRLLDALEPSARQRIESQCEPVTLELEALVCEAGTILRHAWFPQGCVLSLLTVLKSGSVIETANIGREGAFGLAAVYSPASFSRCIVQMKGPMVRCPIEILLQEFNHSEALRAVFVKYAEALLAQTNQSVACNALHTTEERVCRWLLMMLDRSDSDHLSYTHEFVSSILGANRKSITLAAQAMQVSGLISYQRGKIQVLDRRGLEAAACECYKVVKRRFDSLFVPHSPLT